ncbi:hypothetical protein OAO01_09695 [Oligoflexia bacterium]|nr:hypothetical protein [Oligoflexia bacterium]
MNELKALKIDFRDAISLDPQEVVVFGVDISSQPGWGANALKNDPFLWSKCSRALPIAREEDIVVLLGKLDEQYYQWIRNLGLGPAHIVEYGEMAPKNPLAECIAMNPTPVQEAIARTGRKPLFVPFYSGQMEQRAAKSLNAKLYGGAPEKIIKKYFQKDSFKNECIRLGIPVVEGEVLQSSGKKGVLDKSEFAKLVSTMLRNYPAAVVRGSEGAGGSSVYTVTEDDVQKIYYEIKACRPDNYLIEPLLQVVASPNDQWVVSHDGAIRHLELSAQLFEGLKHAGNLRGQYFAPRVEQYIFETSAAIMQQMAEDGYQGVAGIDYIVCDEGIFPIENNARVNGSTFAVNLVDRLQRRHKERIKCWKFFKAETDPCSYAELVRRIESVLYDLSKPNAVFPIDCDTLPYNGKFSPVIIAEDIYHIQHLERALRELGVTRV